jgi:hypothetical protein
MTPDSLAALVRGEPRAWSEAGRLDPAVVLASAAAHGILPLIAEQASRQTPPSAALRSALDAEIRRGAPFELVREHELRTVVAALADAGVRALLMKGADLAYSLYDRPDERPRIDSDLLVPADMRASATAVLTSLGYTAVPQTGGDLLMYQEPFRKTRQGSDVHVVDLHWRVANPQRFAGALEFDLLASAAEPRPRLAPAARGLSAVHGLLLACVHRVAHHFDSQRLIWSYDVHLLATSLSPHDWRTVTALARARAVEGACLRGLLTASRCFGTVIPEAVVTALREGSRVEAGNAPFFGAHVRHAERILSDLRNVRSWRERWRLACQHAFPPGSYMRDVYAPASSAPLWLLYALRIARGSRKWLSRT